MASQIASNTNVAYIFMILFPFQKARNTVWYSNTYPRFQLLTFVYIIFINVPQKSEIKSLVGSVSVAMSCDQKHGWFLKFFIHLISNVTPFSINNY